MVLHKLTFMFFILICKKPLIFSNRSEINFMTFRIGSYERVIPVKLLGKQSNVETVVRETCKTKEYGPKIETIIKRYVYNPETMAHNEYVLKVLNQRQRTIESDGTKLPKSANEPYGKFS